MQPHIAAAIKTATTADLLDVLSEILDPSMSGTLGRDYAEDAHYDAFIDECIPIYKAYIAAYPRLAQVRERSAA